MEGSPEKTPFKKPALIIGRQPVAEALESGRAIDKVLLQANASGDIIGRIRSLASRQGIPVQVVPAMREHLAFLRVLAAGDREGALAQMMSHIEHSKHRVLAGMLGMPPTAER